MPVVLLMTLDDGISNMTLVSGNDTDLSRLVLLTCCCAVGCSISQRADSSRTAVHWRGPLVYLQFCYILPLWLICLHPYVTGWWSGIVVIALTSINEVNLRWARLVLRWATVSGFSSWCRILISVCNQPATQGQLSLPSPQGQ